MVGTAAKMKPQLSSSPGYKPANESPNRVVNSESQTRRQKMKVGDIESQTKDALEQPISSDRCMLLSLPNEIITRILYFVYVSSNNSEDSSPKIRSLLSILYTCKSLYFGFQYMLYSLKPITLTDMGNYKNTRNNHLFNKSILDVSYLRIILSNELIYKRIKVLNVLTKSSSSISNLGGMSYITILSLIANRVNNDDCNFDSLLMNNLKQFNFLNSLVIFGDSIKSLKYLFHSPDSLIKFQLNLNLSSKFVMFDIKKKELQEIESLINRINSLEKFNFNLEYFKISSNKSIMQSKVHSLFLINKFNLSSSDEQFIVNYFNLGSVRKFEEVTHNNKLSLIRSGELLYKILQLNKYSLKAIEFEKFDFALVLNKNFKNLELNYEFPKLRMLLIDNISSIRLDTWLIKFQLNNLSIRNGKPLLIVMNNSISGHLLTKTTTSILAERHNTGSWTSLPNPKKALEEIKLELDLVC